MLGGRRAETLEGRWRSCSLGSPVVFETVDAGVTVVRGASPATSTSAGPASKVSGSRSEVFTAFAGAKVVSPPGVGLNG